MTTDHLNCIRNIYDFLCTGYIDIQIDDSDANKGNVIL